MVSDWRFPDLRKLLEQAGYQLVRVHSSHHIFAKAGQSPLSIPVHRGKVKAFYVRQVKKILQDQDD